MHHHSSRIAILLLLTAAAPAALAATTIIHAGQLLAVPGEKAKSQQTVVIEDQRIREIRNGYADPAEFDGEVTVIDLKGQFVLPGLMDVHVHLQGELGPANTRPSSRSAGHRLKTLKNCWTWTLS